MSNTATNAMNYELSGKKEISAKAAKRASREYDVRKMSVWGVLWYEVTEHWVGLLATFGVGYIIFDNFGTLLVGLVESLFN